MSTTDKPGSSLDRWKPAEAPPFQPVRSTDQLIEVYAREVLDSVRVELETCNPNDEDPWEVAEDYARARIELGRSKLYESVLAVMGSPDVLLYTAHELQLLAQLADSLELPR